MNSLDQGYNRSRLVVSLFFFLQGLNFATWASRIPDIKQALSLSEAELGGVLFAMPIGQICAMALSAWVVKRFESINTLAVAALLCPLFLLPLGVATTPFALCVALFLYGAVTNLYNISINTQGVDVERIYSKNIMATFHGVWSLGGFLGGVLSMVFVAIDLPTFQHFSIVCVGSIIVAILFRKGFVPQDVRPETATTNDDEAVKIPFWRRFDSYILLLGVMSFGAMICQGAMYDWSGVYFSDVVNAPDNLVRLGYIVCMSTMTMGRFLSDGMKSRFGTVTVVRASGLLIAFGIMIAVISPTLIFATLGLFFVGFGISSTVPICYSLAGKSATLSPSVALAAVSTIGYLGFLVGPPVIGFIAHAISLRWTFAVIAIIGLSITFLASRLKD
ncbi:MAG: MFS transporter [Rikenellaceae bacterium]